MRADRVSFLGTPTAMVEGLAFLVALDDVATVRLLLVEDGGRLEGRAIGAMRGGSGSVSVSTFSSSKPA